MNRSDYLKLVVFIPESHLEQVKAAVFSAGAGVLGAYENCCWQTSGVGQFSPRPGANPFLGQPGELEQVAESRVEMLVQAGVARAVVHALREAHPYEEPAFELLALASLEDLP